MGDWSKYDPPTVEPDEELGDPSEMVGQVISARYRIKEVIASGGIGNVYVGQHIHMRKRVAIKILNSAADRLPHVKARFEREAMAGAHIEHPNVAAATDFGRLPEGSYFLIMEYIDGETLREAMAEGQITPQRAVHIGRQIAAGLHAAHAVGIIHRDLKPANIMLVRGTDDQVKLIDFGFAKVDFAQLPETADGRLSSLPQAVTGIGQAFGTPPYMAPEAIVGMDFVDARSDLYALGVILFELLAKVRPLEDPDPVRLLQRKREEEAPPLSDFLAPGAVPEELEKLIMQLLARDKFDRPLSGKEVAERLEAIETTHYASMPYPKPSVELSAKDASPTAVLAREQTPSGEGPEAPRSRTNAALESAPTLIDSLRRNPPQGVRTPARRKPWKLVLGLAGSALALALAAGAAWTLWPRNQWSSAASASAASSLPAQALSLALSSAPSVPASEPPVSSAPPPSGSSAEVVTARSDFWKSVARKDWKGGATALGALVERDPRCFEEPGFVRAASSVVAMLDLIDPKRADEAFQLLAERSGPGGVDVLYDVAVTRGTVRGPGKKALALLEREDVRKRASPATRVAVELHIGTCPERRALYDRAVAEGDERALRELQWLLSFRCDKKGKSPCCFRADKGLQDAITQLRAKYKN